mgnify:CR=1 FL=1
MSQAKKTPSFYLLLMLLSLIVLFSQVACSPTQRDGFIQAGQVFTEEVDKALVEPEELVFAGQVEDENGRWLNNCVVVLFKNGEEVARTTSGLMDSSFSDNGPMDGVFELRVANVYKLSLAHEIYHPNRVPVSMSTVPGVVGTRYLGTWFENLNPTDMRVLNVPDKQLEYALVVLPMPQDELPDGYSPGKLSFKNGTLITNQADEEGNENLAAQATAVPNPTPAPESNIQFVVLPAESSGQAWNLKMTGYYGNRWDVWERFIAGRIPGMNWETFKYSVLVHNPHLETDGFVFYPEKSYLLPFNQ